MRNETFLRFCGFKTKCLTLSYDDGEIADRRLVGIFNKYGIKATFNICSGNFKDSNHVGEDEVLSLYLKNGHEVATHGVEHLSLTEVDPAIATKEILNCREELERITGKIIKGMAYANGKYDDTVIGILKSCGISYSRTTVKTHDFHFPDDWLLLNPTCHHDDEKLFELADAFLDNEKKDYYWSNFPKMFYVWGHSFEFNRKNNWDRIEKFCEKVGNKDDVWYATNGEIYNYVTAYKRLIYSVDGSKIYNPTDTDLWINYMGKDLFIRAGETVIGV